MNPSWFDRLTMNGLPKMFGFWETEHACVRFSEHCKKNPC